MMRNLWLAGALLAFAGTGCVERKFVVTSEVSGSPNLDAGAMLYVNGEQLGPTPRDVYYTYYGNYHLTLVKDGFETLQVDQKIPSPWYEWPPIDFFAENVNPFKVRDVRDFHYALMPVQGVRPEDVLNRGQLLRDRGLKVVPLPDATPPPPKPGPPPPKPGPPLIPADGTSPLGPPRPLPPGS
jgi:hypothetical protein